jgi:hypothetical protein
MATESAYIELGTEATVRASDLSKMKDAMVWEEED